MICVSIGYKNSDEIIEILKEVEFAEIRFDLCNISLESLAPVFATGKAIIGTYRKTATDDAVRAEYLSRSIELGAKYIDLAPSTDGSFLEPLMQKAKAHGCKVILSHHDYLKVPSIQEIKDLADEFLRLEPDIIKFVFKSVSEVENRFILSLYDYFNKLTDRCRFIFFGLGEPAKATRPASLACGAPFMYASIDDSCATAPGQISYKEDKTMINIQLRKNQ